MLFIFIPLWSLSSSAFSERDQPRKGPVTSLRNLDSIEQRSRTKTTTNTLVLVHQIEE